MDKNRIEAFSDGIFGVAATLLVVELRLPDAPTVAQGILLVFPKLCVFVLSFLIVAVYWVAHHTMFDFVSRVDRGLLWLNNFTLLGVAALPFPTAVLGSHPLDPTAIIVYATALSFINCTGVLAWRYVSRNTALCEAKLTTRLARAVTWVHLAPVAGYAVAAGVAFVQPRISLVILGAVPLFFIFPNRVLRKALGQGSAF
ncbi:MAG: TMEM175 family protein [Terracidiphilus sp.]